jgi:RNA polymerase sigma-70 factor (ECF subfamily)
LPVPFTSSSSLVKSRDRQKNQKNQSNGIDKRQIQGENWTMNNESELVKKISLGDAAAFEKLFKSYFQLLVDFCFRFVEDVSIAENIVQEVFLKIWANRAKLDPGIKIKYYLYRAVKNKALNHLRHLKVVKNSAQDVYRNNIPGKTPEEEINEEEMVELLIKAIEKLPEKCKIIFLCVNMII